MALYLQSKRYQTCYFLGKSVAYVQIPMMTFSFPFGQYEKTFITGNMAIYVLGYKIFFYYYVIFLIKILKVACLKTNAFFPILVKKKVCIKAAYLYKLKYLQVSLRV